MDVEGHVLWPREKFIEMGFAPAVVDRSLRDHVSGDEIGSQIIDEERLNAAVDAGQLTEGQADLIRMLPGEHFTKEHLVAVHEIDFLRDLAEDLEVPMPVFLGRGTFGRALAQNILKYLEGNADTEAQCE
jgi:hypothetical protein